MINEIKIINNIADPIKGCVVLLPGRGLDAELMGNLFKAMELPNTIGVAIEPHRYAWYPAPNGIDDQEEAVAGVPVARSAIEKQIEIIHKGYEIPYDKIALVGFSAGAVMALQVAAHSQQPFAAVISLAGAILDSKSFPKANGLKTPILLQHNFDDSCFDWYERYLPMYHCLTKNNYQVDVMENWKGEHQLTRAQAIMCGEYLNEILGYEQWTHSVIENGLPSQLLRLNDKINYAKLTKVHQSVKNHLKLRQKLKAAT